MNTRLLVENAKDLQEKMLEGAKDQILRSGPKKNQTELKSSNKEIISAAPQSLRYLKKHVL